MFATLDILLHYLYGVVFDRVGAISECQNSHFQNEAKSKSFHVKISFVCTNMKKQFSY